MRVLLFHGYLLGGTGSNVYTAEVARALGRLGHEVHLVSQERDPERLATITGHGDITPHRPDIGSLLPVYVHDHYEGFDRVEVFPALKDDELERYIDANVRALHAIADEHPPDLALAGHLVMGPALVHRGLGGVPYAVKIHGSALEYVVRPHPDRYLPYAREGTEHASAILTGSRHTAESLFEVVGDDLRAKTRLGPPGVDIEAFAPREPAAARAALADLIERLDGTPPTEGRSSFARDPREAVDALRRVGDADRLVVFVGKLIDAKGADLLIDAWPAVLAEHPDARLVVVGFGADRPALEQRARDVPRLHFAGRLEHDELHGLLPAAEALVMPSRFPEAFGMVAAEAAAAGAFPIVAGHSGMAEVAHTLAGVVPAQVRPLLTFDPNAPDAPEQLATNLVGWLAADPATRERTREAIVARTRERYSWEGVARTILAAAAGDLDGLEAP